MLTLKKVKELVEAPSHAKRTPSPKMLFEEGIVLLRREFDQGSHLTVYNSGYVLFSAGKRNTVFHIHDCCGDYAYDAAEGKGDVIEEEYFENCEWHIRALFEGERKMEDNQAKCEGAGRSNLSTMFTAVNQQTSEIAAQVGQTPQGWNSSIFSMIRNISDSVVIPIAGIIITLILCYELISMLTERNNLHDVDTWMFFKYFVKMWIAVYLVSHTFDIAMAVFDIGQSVVNSSSGIIRGNTAIDISSLSMQMQAAMATMAIGELVTLALETLVVSWCLKILSVVITVIMYGRMIEIYLYTSLAPIPFATMSNREWGHVGTNYFRGLFALAFQAFLMMVCVAIYAALIGSIRVSSDIHSALFGTMAYTVILCFSLLKTGSLSKQIFGSH